MKIKIPERLDAPETRLFVETITKDNKTLGSRQVILLVPGGPGGNHTVYNAVRENLLEFSDLILFDPRGCGYSDFSEPEFCTLQHYINDIDSLRKYFQLSKIILMGGSYGAMASLGYVIQYGVHVEKLILVAGSPSYRFIETAQRNLKERGTLEQIKAAENLWNGTFKDPEHFKEYYKIMASLYLYKQIDAKGLLPPTRPNIPYNISVTNLGFRDFLRKFDFEPWLQKISCETLILSGKNDWINDPSHATLMAHKIPKSTLVILENCSHFIWEDQRERFFKAIYEFLTTTQHCKLMMQSKL